MAHNNQEDVCNEKVFHGLFQEYAEDLHRFLYYRFGTGYPVEDMVQDAFTKLWQNCKKVTVEKAKAFLFTVSRNQTLNEASKRSTALQYSKDFEIRYDQESPEYRMEEKEYMDQINEALESLTEAQRVAFMLNRVEGKKHQEIADILGISRKAVEKRIYGALSVLREKLGDI